MESLEPGSRARPLARAACALLALAASALAISPDPPRDRLLPALEAFLAARSPLLRGLAGSAFALLAGAGAAAFLLICLGALVDRLRAGKAGSAGARRFRRRRLASTLVAYALLLLALRFLRGSPAAGIPAAGAGYTVSGHGAARGGGGASGGGAARRDDVAYRVPFLLLAAAGALASGGVGAALLAARAGRRRKLAGSARPLPPETGEGPPREAEGLGPARRALESGSSARAAVVASYAEMCRLFAAAPRFGPASPSLTARELAAFLRARGAGSRDIAELTAVFEKARYSNEDCGEADRLAAARALASIELAYGGGRS
ncbi:MAG TPA: DUF4129 domain-containing protein [Spirochaetales bacterium]|nr:DUF4129 domain-containing protein [Spirochaetales bacterium]HRY54696.1 DUF4129 domain-containing protein [Spirochaetia bacterium]HRZ63338.1 DUF4129 domain-containing protein [Spirochaetia bacterium]